MKSGASSYEEVQKLTGFGTGCKCRDFIRCLVFAIFRKIISKIKHKKSTDHSQYLRNLYSFFQASAQEAEAVKRSRTLLLIFSKSLTVNGTQNIVQNTEKDCSRKSQNSRCNCHRSKGIKYCLPFIGSRKSYAHASDHSNIR